MKRTTLIVLSVYATFLTIYSLAIPLSLKNINAPATKDAYFVLDYRDNQNDALLQREATITSQIIATWKVSSVSNRIGVTFNSREETLIDQSDPGTLLGSYNKDLTTLYTEPKLLSNFVCFLENKCDESLYPIQRFSTLKGPTLSSFLFDFQNALLTMKSDIELPVESPSSHFTFILFTQPDNQQEIDKAVTLIRNDAIFTNYTITYIIIRINKNDGLDYSKLSTNVFDIDNPFLGSIITNLFKPL